VLSLSNRADTQTAQTPLQVDRNICYPPLLLKATMQHPLKHLTLTLALMLSALTANAHNTKPTDMEWGMGMGMGGNMNTAKMDAMMAKRHADLKAKLKITAEQEGAWTAFTQAMKPMGEMGYMTDMAAQRAEMMKLNTPDRIDKMRGLRQERMADMQKIMDQRDDATKTFYGNLSTDQMKLFDAEHARMGSMQGMRKMHEKYGNSKSEKNTANPDKK
jgi:protein CpxP